MPDIKNYDQERALEQQEEAKIVSASPAKLPANFPPDLRVYDLQTLDRALLNEWIKAIPEIQPAEIGIYRWIGNTSWRFYVKWFMDGEKHRIMACSGETISAVFKNFGNILSGAGIEIKGIAWVDDARAISLAKSDETS